MFQAQGDARAAEHGIAWRGGRVRFVPRRLRGRFVRLGLGRHLCCGFDLGAVSAFSRRYGGEAARACAPQLVQISASLARGRLTSVSTYWLVFARCWPTVARNGRSLTNRVWPTCSDSVSFNGRHPKATGVTCACPTSCVVCVPTGLRWVLSNLSGMGCVVKKVVERGPLVDDHSSDSPLDDHFRR